MQRKQETYSQMKSIGSLLVWNAYNFPPISIAL